MPKFKLQSVRCDNCKYATWNIKYKYEGECSKDNRYIREHHVCDLLDSDELRREAKLRRNG